MPHPGRRVRFRSSLFRSEQVRNAMTAYPGVSWSGPVFVVYHFAIGYPIPDRRVSASNEPQEITW